MHIRNPDIQPDHGALVWSKIPEFSLSYNGYSVIIPHVEYYLNSIMNDVRKTIGTGKPELKRDLDVFIKHEMQHAKFHKRFNQRMYDAGYAGLQAIVDKLVADLQTQRRTRSLAFNVAYCAGFECIATFDSKYLYERCDEFFEGADPHGANLLLWHVAEEFEHRSVCHDAFHAVSNSYFTRIHGLLYAFWHVGGAFMHAEELVLDHYCKNMSDAGRAVSSRRSKRLFWRQLRYVAPRMLQILLPGYNPAKLKVPGRIESALEFFRTSDPLRTRVELAVANGA